MKAFWPLACLSLLLGVALGSVPGLALCAGRDGHVAIEKVDSDCCDCAATPESSHGGSAPVDCNDTRLGIWSAMRIESGGADAALPAISLHHSPIGLAERAAVARVHSDATRRPISPPLHLRSTVLLC